MCLAAHIWSVPDGLPEMSNCYCHPGKAGGLPFLFIDPSKGGRQCLPTGDGYSPALHLHKNGKIIPVRFINTSSSINYNQEYLQRLETYNESAVEWIARTEMEPGDTFDLKEGQRIVATGIYESYAEQGDSEGMPLRGAPDL